MRRLFLLLGLCILAGCGGGSAPATGGGNNPPPVVNTSRAGTWKGTVGGWRYGGVPSQSGAMTLMYDASDHITGTYLVNGATWTISGNGSQSVNILVTGPDQTVLPGTGELAATDSHLTGSLRIQNPQADVPSNMAIDLVRQ